MSIVNFDIVEKDSVLYFPVGPVLRHIGRWFNVSILLKSKKFYSVKMEYIDHKGSMHMMTFLPTSQFGLFTELLRRKFEKDYEDDYKERDYWGLILKKLESTEKEIDDLISLRKPMTPEESSQKELYENTIKLQQLSLDSKEKEIERLRRLFKSILKNAKDAGCVDFSDEDFEPKES